MESKGISICLSTLSNETSHKPETILNMIRKYIKHTLSYTPRDLYHLRDVEIRKEYQRRRYAHSQIDPTINTRSVYERDKGICQICYDPVKHQDAHMDHIVPFKHNGSHTWDNVRLTHSWCNLRRGFL